VGTVLPSLKIELPSGLIGCKKKVPSVGAWNVTQTVNVTVAVFLQVSEAVQVTTVLPGANIEPEAGEQLTGRMPSIASVAVGFVYVTTAPAAQVA
jgi:hypothetical protein